MENISNNHTYLGINRNTIDRLINDKNEAEKAYKALENYKNYGIKDSYDFFNKLSCGNNSRAYNKFTYDKLAHSLEYTSVFKYLRNKKAFNLNTPEGLDLHVYRNKNQYKKAPRDLDSMMNFVKAGYFIFEGFAPCHNIRKNYNDYKGRRKTLIDTIWLVKRKQMYSPNQFAPLYNISFRGTPGTSFEGCQFIYNHLTGKLVCDNINRGTWDYGKYGEASHYILDIHPWLVYGNGDNIENVDMFIMTYAEEKLFMNDEAIKKAMDNKKKSSIFMSDKYILDQYLKYLKYDKENTAIISDLAADEENRDLIIKRLTKTREDFIDYEFKKNSEKRYSNESLSNIDIAYKDAWFDYVSLLTCVENREIQSGLADIVSFISTNPDNLKNIIYDSEEKRKYEKLMLKYAMDIKSEARTEGTKISFMVPLTMDVYLTTEAKKDIISDENDYNKEKALNQLKFTVDSMVALFNRKIERFNFEVVVLSDFEAILIDLDRISIGFRQFRMVSKLENKILSEKVLNKDASEFSEKNNVEFPDDVKNNETLVNPVPPEYLDEKSSEAFSFFNPKILIATAAIITIACGGTKMLYDKISRDKMNKLTKDMSKELADLIGKEYYNIKSIDKTIKHRVIGSKLINAIAKYDKFGRYNIYEHNDLMNKADYINERITQLISHIKKSRNYTEFLNNIKDDEIAIKICDGYIFEDVFNDPSLLDELVRFEYGSNGDLQYYKEEYVKSFVEEVSSKLTDSLFPLITKDDDVEAYFKRNDNAIDWEKLGKNPIINQMKFNLGYIYKINTDFTKFRELVEDWIKKA